MNENTTTKQILKLPLSEIVLKEQPRTQFNDNTISDLAQSIKEYGLINPITVMVENNHYVLLTGERRLRACRDVLKWQEIDAILIDTPPNADQILKIQLIENAQREDLSPIDTCNALTKLLTIELDIKADQLLGFVSTSKMLESIQNTIVKTPRYDKTLAHLNQRFNSYNHYNYEKLLRLSKTLGFSLHKIYKYLSLAKIIPEIRSELIADHQEKYQDGIYSITLAPYLLNLSPTGQLEVYAYAKQRKRTYNQIKNYARDVRHTEKKQAIIKKYQYTQRNCATERKIETAQLQGVGAVKEDYQMEYEFPFSFNETHFSIFLTDRHLRDLTAWPINAKYQMRLFVKKKRSGGFQGTEP